MRYPKKNKRISFKLSCFIVFVLTYTEMSGTRIEYRNTHTLSGIFESTSPSPSSKYKPSKIQKGEVQFGLWAATNIV